MWREEGRVGKALQEERKGAQVGKWRGDAEAAANAIRKKTGRMNISGVFY